MVFWIVLILVLLLCYFYAGLCVFIVVLGGDNRNRSDFGERLMMFGLCLFFWPFVPIIALLTKN